MEILIVDDEPTNLKLLKTVLEAEGHSVKEAADGVEALAVLEREPVGVIISDILMPNMDGYRFCYEVRHHEKHHDIPFIIYTSTYTSPADEKVAMEAGANKYIRKPAPVRVLMDALDEVASDPKYRGPRLRQAKNERDLMKSYSEALVRKLEEQNARLERAQAEITKINEELERRVKDRTAELEVALEELEAFSYSAAHDLRAPLRAISGYSGIVLGEHGDELNVEGKQLVQRIQKSALKMNSLIDQLLNLANVSRGEISHQSVDLSNLVRLILLELHEAEPSRQVQTTVEPGIMAEGDMPLLRIAFQNLLNNAWKFTAKTEHPHIEFGRSVGNGGATCYLRDNGAGFDMAYAAKLFSPFQRMHSQSEFEGTGLGLAIVQRIVSRHGGRIWVESVEGSGTTFHLAL